MIAGARRIARLAPRLGDAVPARPARLGLPLTAWLVLACLISPALGEAQAATPDDPALQPPFSGQVPPPLERVGPGARPPGFELSAAEAVELAEATDVFAEERAEAEAPARAVPYLRGEDAWQVDLVAADPGDDSGSEQRLAFAVVDDASGEVREAWNDQQLGSELARGYEGAIAQSVNSPWMWIGLSLLFVAPFFDPRRPLRLLHLDLLAVLALGASLAFFNDARITASVLLALPVLGYVLVRSLLAGLRPRRRVGPLLPLVGPGVLVVACLVLLAGRISLNVGESRVIDVGTASVVGADRALDGEELYAGDFSPGLDLRGDVYGPANYLAYAPFEQAFPWEGAWDDVPAAHAAAIAFDLLCVLGLLALGRRLRAGPEGRTLGFALAFAWLACPFTLYAMNANANDSLVAALGIGALLALPRAATTGRTAPATSDAGAPKSTIAGSRIATTWRPAGLAAARGAAVALAALAKFGSAATAPLFATGTGERGWRDAMAFSIAFGILCVALFAPFVPDGGLAEIYDRTFGYQASRSSPFSIWGQAPSLEPLQAVARVLAVLLALVVAFLPRRRDAIQLAALAAAVTVAVQLTATHWFYFYVVWFLPFFLVAALGEQDADDPPEEAGVPPARARSAELESPAAKGA